MNRDTQYTDEYLSDEGILWEIANYDMAREWQGAEIDNIQSNRMAQLFALFSRTDDATLEVQYSEICECILDDIKPVKRNQKPVKPETPAVNLDQVPYDPEVDYPVADPSYVEFNEEYAEWLASLTPTTPETLDRFTLIESCDNASAGDLVCALVDDLEDRLSFFRSPIIVAGLYVAQVITLLAFIYLNFTGRN